MITPDDARRIRDQLLTVLDEDAQNTAILASRLDAITHESGIGAHAALLLILTHLAFEEEEARRHWEAILAHRGHISASLGRDAGVRVAALDYFLHINRRLTHPTLIDLRMRDVTEAGSEVDSRTGLATERRFRAAVQSELRRARRYNIKAAVVLADLDGFRKTNERFGELVCDRLLRETAILIGNGIRDIDVAARPGGDEFGLLLPETDRTGALLVAERLRRSVESYFGRRESGGTPVGLTLSAGVVCYPEDATTPELLLERAGQALYRAKATGGNVVHVYHPERRRYLRFELEPGRFEVEVLGAAEDPAGAPRNLSRNGILFGSPEAIEIGEEIEIRLRESLVDAAAVRPLRLRGRVVRLEELPPPERSATEVIDDRFEIGVAFDLDWGAGSDDLLEFLERANDKRGSTRS